LARHMQTFQGMQLSTRAAASGIPLSFPPQF
jgi:hypothetical protein